MKELSSQELYIMVELLAKQVSAESSEEKKTTILEDIKPSSFAWIIECMLDYIKQRGEVE
jgi:hypothetical protein